MTAGASAPVQRSLAGDADAAAIRRELPRRRRRLGLALVGLGVFGLAAQSWFEWLLPYDPASLDVMRRLSHLPGLRAATLVWSWALLCGALLLSLARAGSRPQVLALACGLALGSAEVAAGGASASLAVLVLVGLASLGWQSLRHGGLVLLAATAAAVAGWDLALSDYPSLWIVASVLALLFLWIDRQHIRANDRRLFAALAERDSLIASLDQRSAELTALQGARTRLLAGISHDLRQPLQAVRLFADALSAGGPEGLPAARWQDLLRQQTRAADDAVSMLDQFSEFSAIEQGALQSHPDRVDVRELLDTVAASLRAIHPAAHLRLRVHGRRQWLHIDRTQLARVVQNLAGNAARYSLGARPGVTARVVLAVRPHRLVDGSQGLAIDIVDNGRGIPADKLDAVFEPYVQLAEAGGGASRGGRGRGLGLGLAIVRGLSVQLGLQLAPVRSVPGRGTRLRIVVPATLRRPAPESSSRDAETAATLDGWLLAVLDDEPGPREALRAALEGVGATVVDAASLADLEVRLGEEVRFPDALVFDLDLGPGQPDGLAAVDALRAAWESDVPAVIVTGRIAVMGTVPLPRRCTLLAKPVPLQLLVGVLHRLLPVPPAA